MLELLDKKHNREDFDCGKELLNNYLKNQAGQDIKRKLSACFVLIDTESNLIQGFYTLSSSSVSLNSFPEHIQLKLPRSYSSIPTTLLGRLAIDKRYQGKRIGEIILIDALKRSYENSQIIGSYAVVVDPIDEQAAKFYQKYGFIQLLDTQKMFISLKTIQELLNLKIQT